MGAQPHRKMTIFEHSFVLWSQCGLLHGFHFLPVTTEILLS
jgi:hypothetical protein